MTGERRFEAFNDKLSVATGDGNLYSSATSNNLSVRYELNSNSRGRGVVPFVIIPCSLYDNYSPSNYSPVNVNFDRS